MKGARIGLDREERGHRYLAWHMVRPHAGKRFPTLKEFMGGAVDKPPTPTDLETSLRKWRAVMASVDDQAARRANPVRPTAPPDPGV